MFHPGFLALWPGKSGEVEVTLRSRGVGKYHALLEAHTLHIKCSMQAFAGKNAQIFRKKNADLNIVFFSPWDGFFSQESAYGAAVMSAI